MSQSIAVREGTIARTLTSSVMYGVVVCTIAAALAIGAGVGLPIWVNTAWGQYAHQQDQRNAAAQSALGNEIDAVNASLVATNATLTASINATNATLTQQIELILEILHAGNITEGNFSVYVLTNINYLYGNLSIVEGDVAELNATLINSTAVAMACCALVKANISSMNATFSTNDAQLFALIAALQTQQAAANSTFNAFAALSTYNVTNLQSDVTAIFASLGASIRTINSVIGPTSNNVFITASNGISADNQPPSTLNLNGSTLANAITDADNSIAALQAQVTTLQAQVNALNTSLGMIATEVNGTVVYFNMSIIDLMQMVASLNATVTALATNTTVVHTGTMVPWAGTQSNVPAGYLYCDGSVVSQSTYAALFAVILCQYCGGQTCGVGTFCLPDLRGRVPVGLLNTSTNFYLRGLQSGGESVTLTVNQLAAHTHTYSGATNVDGEHAHDLQLIGGMSTSTGQIDPTAQFEGTARTGVTSGGSSATLLFDNLNNVPTPPCTGPPASCNPLPFDTNNFLTFYADDPSACAHTYQGGALKFGADAGPNQSPCPTSSAHNHSYSGTTASTGTAQPVNVVQPSLTVGGYIIKT